MYKLNKNQSPSLVSLNGVGPLSKLIHYSRSPPGNDGDKSNEYNFSLRLAFVDFLKAFVGIPGHVG